MSEERRTTVTVSVSARRLGLYLEPAEDNNGGAFIARFDDVDGEAGEVAQSGLVRVGFRLERVEDAAMLYAPFNSIVAALVKGPRPISLTFRDPDVPEFRDAFGFLRPKLHTDCMRAIETARADTSRRNDLDWLAFLDELGGKRGKSFGVQRLLRDAAGEVVFPEDPAPRINAVSPTHGRIEGFSHDRLPPPSPPPASPSAAAGSGSIRLPSSQAPTVLSVIGIHKRCWRPNGVGVACPPGLQTVLPGVLPSPKERARLMERLVSLVVNGGIPVAFRPTVWWELSGASAKAALHPPAYYERLAIAKPTSEVLSEIEKDIDRTFPGHAAFETAKGQDSLRRLLSAFSLHNPEVGYCQGLNFLAGFLLLLMGEERAFWLLDILVNEILPQDYYSKLKCVNTDQRVLAQLVSNMMPTLADAYRKSDVDLEAITTEWFMCLFCTVLPTSTALRVWDTLWLFGSQAIFRTALALFYINKDRMVSIATSATTSSVSVTQGASGDATPGGGISVSAVRGRGGAGSSARNFFSATRSAHDTIKETADKVLAALAATEKDEAARVDSTPRSDAGGLAGEGGATGADEADGGEGGGSASATPRALSPASPLPAAHARGGTIRSPQSTFPALFEAIKSMPLKSAYDADKLMRLAFPLGGTPDVVDMGTHVTPDTIRRLRAQKFEQVEREIAEEDSRRASAGLVFHREIAEATRISVRGKELADAAAAVTEMVNAASAEVRAEVRAGELVSEDVLAREESAVADIAAEMPTVEVAVVAVVTPELNTQESTKEEETVVAAEDAPQIATRGDADVQIAEDAAVVDAPLAAAEVAATECGGVGAFIAADGDANAHEKSGLDAREGAEE